MIFGVLQFVALYLLAGAMPQHRCALLGRWQTVYPARTVAIAGWVLLTLSFVTAIATPHPTAIVTWFGLLPLASGMILAGLSYSPHILRWAPLGVFTLLIVLMLRP